MSGPGLKNICRIAGILQDAEKHRSFIDAVLGHLECQVNGMGSVKGIVVRKTYASLKAIRPGYVRHVIEVLSRDYIVEFSGMHDAFIQSQELPCLSPGTFEAYVAAHFEEAEGHFWHIADDYAAKRSQTLIGKAYRAGRGMIASYLPQMLAIICQELDRHTIYEV